MGLHGSFGRVRRALAQLVRPDNKRREAAGRRSRRRRNRLESSNRAPASRSPGIECLESRNLLSANVVISEFMAINSSGLGGTTDSFGNKSDWIEIHNNGVSPVDLAGWKLADGSGTWTFPSEPTWINSVLAANSYLTVYASGEDTVTLGGTQLHTNFKLSSDGEYLALLRPDGSVANEYAPQYPAQLSDVSYGITEATTTTTLLTQGAAGRILVPTSAARHAQRNGAEQQSNRLRNPLHLWEREG
jgi:hypothetical protein